MRKSANRSLGHPLLRTTESSPRRTSSGMVVSPPRFHSSNDKRIKNVLNAKIGKQEFGTPLTTYHRVESEEDEQWDGGQPSPLPLVQRQTYQKCAKCENRQTGVRDTPYYVPPSRVRGGRAVGWWSALPASTRPTTNVSKMC